MRKQHVLNDLKNFILTLYLDYPNQIRLYINSASQWLFEYSWLFRVSRHLTFKVFIVVYIILLYTFLKIYKIPV